MTRAEVELLRSTLAAVEALSVHVSEVLTLLREGRREREREEHEERRAEHLRRLGYGVGPRRRGCGGGRGLH